MQPLEQVVPSQRVAAHWIDSIRYAPFPRKGLCEAVFLPETAPALLARCSHDGGIALSVIGPLEQVRRKAFAAPAFYVRIVLREGPARELLGVPLRELTGRVVSVQDLWPAEGARLLERMSEATHASATETLEAFVLERGRRAPTSRAHLIGRAIRELSAPEASAVDRAARAVGVSCRHLQRLFLDEIGMSPKQYARISRLRRALLFRRRMRWAAAACEAGFSDQSHLVREFRDLLQVTPDAYWLAYREYGTAWSRGRSESAPPGTGAP